MTGAIAAASDSNDAALGSDLADNAIAQHLDAVEDNASEKSINDDNNINENALKMGADASDNILKDSGTTTVNNWAELQSAISDGAVIELAGDDVYYAEGSGINIDSVSVTIDGKGHTIDAQGLNSHIFDIYNGATLTLKNLILKNALNNGEGGAIYINQGTLTVISCTFTNNTATTERGGAIYNYEGTLKIVNSKFEKNVKYDRAIYNYGTEGDPFRLTIINTTMIEDKVCVNYNDNERRLDDKRDIDLLTTEVNAYIESVIYEGVPVFINISGIDNDFTGSVTVNITNTIYNTVVDVANGEGNTTMNLDLNRYTARFKNFISLTEEAFERDDTKPYLEINFKVAAINSFTALEDMINKTTNITLNHDYIYYSKTDSAYIHIIDKTLTIYGNGHSISGSTNNGDTLFLIEDDSNVRMENIILENGHAQSRSHLGAQIRMGGAIFVSRSNLTLINSTLKNNEAKNGDGGAIFSEFSTLNIIESKFTDNDAANGKNLYIQGGNGVYILKSNIDEKDIYNEPDWDNNDSLANIRIFNDFNPTLYIANHFRCDETLFNITQPENINVAASVTVNNDSKGDIQFTDGHASADLNLGLGSYVATITTPDFVYYTDSARNLTCTYLAATTASNEFTVIPKTFIVNNGNVGEIFNDADDTLSDLIKPGDILDFQGTIDKNRNLVINKPVNIISSTNNAVINLHTVIGDTENGIPKFSFIINEGASGSNISDLYINNTQTWIYHVDGLYLKNITISVRSANNLGAEIGHTAIRFGNHITLDNCSIFTENTNAPCLVVYVTNNFTFINSKIEGQSKIVSLISFEFPNEVYDAPYDNYDVKCTNNTIKNSVIKTGYPDADPIKISENADHTTIDGVNVYASKPINPGQYATVINSNFYNASCIELGRNAVAYNNTVDGSGSKILNGANAYNNTFNSVTIGKVVFENNIVKNKLTVTSPANVNSNTINSIELSSDSKYSNITNNIISDTITVNDVNITIKFNTINTENDYAVMVNKKGAVVTNNKMWAKTKFGDNAVMKYQDTTVVQDNNPQPSYKLLQNIINGATGIITLGQDYYFNEPYGDDDFDGVEINKDLTIIGNGYTIDGIEKARIFQIIDGANVIIENVNFINGRAHGEDYKGNNHDVGGAITVKSHSNLTLINCSFTNNHAEQNGWGGAVFITGNSTLSIITSNFTDSYAQDEGKVFYALDGNYVNILGCNVDGINMWDIDIVDMGDCIGNDKGDMGLVAPIKIFNTPDLSVNVSNYTEGEEAKINITNPSKLNCTASLNVANKTVSDIQFSNGTALAQLDLTPGKVYSATLTTDYAEYEKDIGLNIAKIYVPTTTATNSFKVMKKPNIQFDVKNITFDQTQTIKATVNGTGYVTIKLNGKTIVDNEAISKTFNCTIKELDAGNYSIELNYSGDEFTNPGVSFFNFTVFKANSSLEINDSVFDYKDTYSIPFSYDAIGIRAEVVNNNASVIVKGNVIEVLDLNAGNYTLRVTTLTDENHNSITKTANIIVNKIDSKIDIPEIILDYGETRNVTVNTTGANGITVKINGKSVPVNGFTIQISGLNVTTNTLTVTTVADDNHNPVTETANIVVNKVNSSIYGINDVVLDYGQSTNITVGTQGATGITAVISKGNVNVENYKINVPVLDAGNYTLTVTTVPDGNHNKVSKTVKITVNKVNSSIDDINDVVLDYGKSTSINVGTQGATGITAVISKGNVNVVGNMINVPVLDAGDYTLTVTTVPDDNHNPVSKTVKITVNKVNSTIKIGNDISFNYGGSTVIGVGHVGTSGISAKIDNRNIDVDGYNITISNLKAGNHTLTVTSIPDDNHIEVSETVNFVVNKSPSFLNIIDLERNYGSTIIMEVGYKGATGITAKIDDNDATVNGNNITLSRLNAGKHVLTVTTIPDENHTSVTKTANITINKVNSSVSVQDVEVNYGSPIDITVKTDGASGITAKIGDRSIDVEGKTIHVPVLDAGNYTLTVTTIPDDNHNEVTNTSSIKVSKIASEVKIHMASSNYHVGDYFTIAISNNTAASVTINGKTYGIKDNLVEINTTALAAGTYTVVATIAENNNYNESSNTVTFTVSKFPGPNVLIYVEDSVAEGSDLDVNVVVGDATGIVSINGINHTLKNGKASTTFENVKAGDMTINVTYFGDAKYMTSSNSTKVNVYVKKDANLKAYAEDIKVGESATVNVEINPNVTGKVTIGNIEVSITQGKGSHTFNNLPAGTYSLVIGFSGDKFFKAENTTVSFNVVEVQTPVNDTNASAGNETGNNSTSGNATGNNTGGNATGNNDTNTTIVKMDPNLNVNVADVNVGEIAVVNVSINSKVTGKVVVTIKGVKKDLTIVEGKGLLNIYNLTAGSYSVDVSFAGDDYFNASEKAVSFNVIEAQSPTNGTNTSTGNATDNNSTGGNATGDNSTSGNATENNNTNTTIVKLSPELSVSVADVNVGEIVVVNVSINSKVTGKVVVTFNGNDNVVGISNGKGSHMILGLAAGSYSVDVRFAGDDYFNASEKTVSFNVIETQSPTNGTNTSTGNATDNNSTGGNATGDNSTSGNATGNNTTIVKVSPQLSVSVEDVNVGENVVVNVSINSNATGKVVVTVNYEKKVVNISKGMATCSFQNLAAGTYSAVVKYEGDDYFNASEKTVSFKVIQAQNPTNGTNTSTGNATDNNSTGGNVTDNKTYANVTVEPEIVIPTVTNASDNMTIVISLPDDAEGNITVTVDGKDYVFDVSNGTANVELPKLDDGNHEYTITYSGDAKYSGFANKGSLNINNIGTDGNSTASSVIMIPSLDEPSESGSVAMKFPADATGNVTLTVNGKDYVFNVSNGVANVELPKLDDGDYNYTITYSGDDKYSGFTNNDTMKVNNTAVKPDNNTGGNNSNQNTTVEPKINAANANVVYATGKYYSVTVYGTDGKPAKNTKVTFKINGKTVRTVPVDSNGVAKFKVTQVPGTYKVSATALGKTVTKTLKVKHLVTLKTVKVKKSAKKLVLQATLGKINGKYLKNKKITFKFKGKKYYAKTNKKGVAKVTIKKSVLMKLKVGKKVTYQATYLKDTVKKTTKIKK